MVRLIQLLFAAILSVVCLPTEADAQAQNIPRIGFLENSTAELEAYRQYWSCALMR
jgi:hypothetical protein